MENNFAYVDEDDKCYGITGMVISLNIWDKEEMLSHVSLDDDQESISFTPDFFFNGNPRLSAKIAWNEMVKQFQLMTGLMLGNILCRMIVRKRQNATRDLLANMRALAAEEGRDSCSLDDDEIDLIFDKTYNYLSSAYSNPQVAQVARKFAQCLKDRRQMSGGEVFDQLQMLGLR